MSRLDHASGRRWVPCYGVRACVGRCRDGLLCLVVGLIVVGAVIAPPAAAQEEHPVEIEYDGEELVLESAPDQTVEGMSDLPAGSELIVRLRSSSSASPFLKSRAVTVDAAGSFEARFDFSDTDPPIEFTVAVFSDDGHQVSEKVGGRIVEPGTPVRDSTIKMTTMTTVTRGETAGINVSMPAEGSAVLTIGNESKDGYGIIVQLDDLNGDGEVVLRFDTAAAGTAEPTVSVAGDDGYEVLRPEPNLGSSIDPGEYDLALSEEAGGDPVSLGLFVIQDVDADGHDGSDGNDGTDGRDTPSGGTAGDATDSWWYESVPGIAGAVALVSGLAALRLYSR